VSPRYPAPEAAVEAELRDRGSRFFARIEPAPSAEAARTALERERRRRHDATHICFAWRIGWPPAERASDAGEPAGTAGAPILQALATAGLSDALATVARYFGGTQLGRGGLVRAYGGAVRLALDHLVSRPVLARERIAVELPYDRLGALKRLLSPPEIEVAAERYGERVELEIWVAPESRAAFASALAELGLELRAL
jgi:uncharacterized YigZ family protein